MAGTTKSPEGLFLQAVFGDELPEQAASAALQPSNAAILNELRCHVRRLLRRVPFRERSILEMRFGLGDGYAYTLAQAGFVFRLTRERIRQLQVRALRRVRREAGGLREFLERLSGQAETSR